MVSQKYRGSCIGAALAKWLAKNTVASQKMALKEKMEDDALEMLSVIYTQNELLTVTNLPSLILKLFWFCLEKNAV